MLSITFYIDPPFDFEYKNYLLLHYLSEMDESYANLKLSPYLLHTEKLVDELIGFNSTLIGFKSSLKKDIIGFKWNSIIYSETEIIKEVEDINELVEYSVPLLDSRIKLGYKLFKKYPQLLY